MKITKDIFKPLPAKVLLRLFFAISVISIPVLYQFNWSGFGEDSNKSKSIEKTIKDGKIISVKETETEHFQSGKTLWDWLGLAGTLAIPVVLFQFQASEQRRAEKRAFVEKEQAEQLAKVEKQQAEQREKVEKDIAEANLREEAFQDYIDRMSEILINRRSRSELFLDTNEKSNHANADNCVRDVARIRTVTILRRLENDTERQNRVLHFISDTELLQFLLKTANLSGINLSDANLSGANLSGANLSNANLSGANLSDANLSGANLSNIILNDANLTNSNLFNANLTNANLTNANLENSCIQNTIFINADLSNTILVSARTWDEEEIDNNFELISIDDGYSPPYQYEKFYYTDFSGAKLTNANLVSTNFTSVKNLTPEQIKEAKNWYEAIYNKKLFDKLGLPKSLRSIVDSKPRDFDEDVYLEKLIGCQVEVRQYIDNETKTTTRGEITGFSTSNSRVNVKTVNGENLEELSLYEIYIYMTE
ncbi:pentapeptide repeat-containing protein [Calothrix sp. 336/3]|uniref:pentapeptide repeat-containing protein n=1 Tax=Calothrix sp. 336/3 TaxID=1337936 RepID=UPI00069CA588|nr:pentapeptide repeat-containing protein [Calothrix sp. 336/3]